MHDLVVLVDVDHTLLDGNRLRAQLAERVASVGGPEAPSRFWVHYDQLRASLGRVDVPAVGTLLEEELGLVEGCVLDAVLEADFESCVYADALAALTHLERLGLTVVLSDGDERFQLAKIERSGLATAVQGRVLITTHKEQELDEVARRFPARHYALLDDRAGILAAVKRRLGERVTTVLVRQGRYAEEGMQPDALPPDVVVTSMREVLDLERATLLGESA
jgi:FMN phosphatase YigB (HAD superfamily)